MKHIKFLLLVFGLVFSLSACELSDQVNIVDVKESNVSIGIGQSYTLEVVVSSDAATYLQFLSDDVSIATVSNDGVITGVSKGVTSIQVRAGNGFDYVTVRVAGGVLEDAAEEAYVVSTEAEFLEALNEGIYQITLGADITVVNEIVLSHPFEIIHQGFVLDADFSFNDDFYGALAFYQDDETNGPNNAFAGNIDMGERIKPVRIFRHNMSVSYDWLNTYNLQYDVVLDYTDLGDYIPIFTMEDFLAISSSTPHVFAEGTPYQKLHTSYGVNEDFKFLSDITGEVNFIQDVYVVYMTDYDSVRVYDTSWNFIEEVLVLEFEKNPTYQQSNSQAVSTLDIPLVVSDTLPNPASSVMVMHELELEEVNDKISSLDYVNIYGDGYAIQYFALYRELIGTTRNSTFHQIELNNIYADVGSDAVFVNNAYGEFNSFIGIEFNMAYILMLDEDDDYGILIGDNDSGYVVISNINFNMVYFNTDHEESGMLIGYSDESLLHIQKVEFRDVFMVSEDDTNGLLIGKIYKGYAVISEIDLYDVTYHADDYNIGGLIGEVSNAEVSIANVFMYRSTMKITNDSSVGGLIGSVTSESKVSVHGYETNFFHIETTGSYSDNIGGLFGNVENSVLDINNVELTYGTINGDEHVGGVVGLSLNASIQLYNVSVRDYVINGASNVGGFLGQIESSTVIVSDSDVSRITMTSSIHSAGLVGDMNQSVFEVNTTKVFNNDITSVSSSALIIANATHSAITLNRVDAYDNRLHSQNESGSVLSRLEDSSLHLDGLKVRNNTYTVATTFGGLVGDAHGSQITGFIPLIDLVFNQSFEDLNAYYGRLFGNISSYYVELNIQDIIIRQLGLSTLTIEQIEDSAYVGTYDEYNNYFVVRIIPS